MASHTASLAERFGREARDVFEKYGPPIFGRTVRSDLRGVDSWMVAGHDGGMMSYGVGGGMMGEGAHLLIIDDPLNGSKEANSPAYRESLYDWFMSTARNRLNPGGKSAIILMQQRLHTDDLAGRLIAEQGDQWEQLCLTAEADHDPNLGETDPLGRKPGEWLWPDGFTEKEYLTLKSGSSYWWTTQYQQRPVARGGGMIQTLWIEENAVHYIPEADARVRWWDRAATQGGGDYTVGALLSRKGDHFYVEDIVRGQWASGERDRIILATAREDHARYPFGVTTWGEQEPGSSGKDAALAFRKMLLGFPAHCEPSSGSKIDRADGLASAFDMGHVHVCKGHRKGEKYGWYDDLVAEMSTFPAGKHDDIVDACSGAFNKLALFDGDREGVSYVASGYDPLAAYGEVTF